MSAEPQSGAELLKRIRPQLREESTELCMRPDLLEAHEKANEELAQALASASAGARLGSGVPASAKSLAKKIKALEDEIQQNAIVFRMRALPTEKWRALCDKHPPRKNNDMDFYVGYNRDAVTDAAVRLCLVDPVFDDASWAEFLTVCNPSEWAELRSVVNSVNQAVTSAPKSTLASSILERRAPASKPPEPGV